MVWAVFHHIPNVLDDWPSKLLGILVIFCRMHGFAVIEDMNLSGHLSNIDET